jgi:hypothetical protein
MKSTIYRIPFVRDIENTLARRVALVICFPVIFLLNGCMSAMSIIYAWSQNNRALIDSFRKYWRG